MILDKARNFSTNQWKPLQASLELTHRCNERCRHCYIDDFSDDGNRILDFKGWQKVLRELRDAGSLYIILMGGEPLLSPLFFEVCEEAADLGFHTSIISNGLKIKDLDYAKKLKDTGLHGATFSLYSINPKVHDGLTQVKYSCEKTMRAIELCLEVGIEVHVNSLLTAENVSGIFDLEDWCVERKIPLKVDPTITSKLNGSEAPTVLRISEEQAHWFFATRAKRYAKGAPTPFKVEDNGYVCNAAKGKCAVTPYGELLPCIEIREPMGNLIESSFKDIWYQENKWRDFRNKDIEADENYSFCDHCPGMAKNESGKEKSVLPFARMLAKTKRRVYEEINGISPT